MYHAHFGLERGLFGEGIAADSAVFRTARHDRLIAHFKLALGSPSSAVALRGPAGVGKTTLTSTALRMTSTRLALAWLGGTATNPTELLELILVELGLNTQRTTRIERVQLWRQYLAEMRATDSRLFLVVERTEDLPAEVLHSLDQLTAPDASGNPGANLVLLGNEGLDAHLAAPILDSLRQRIRLRGVLEPFSEAELQDYLRHQTACAGGSYDRIFAPGTVAALYRYSRGVARLVNNLCESALDVAAVQQQKQLTADLVARTAVSLLGLPEPVPVPRTTSVALEPAAPADRRMAPRPPAPPPELAPVLASPALVPEPQQAVTSRPAEPPRTSAPAGTAAPAAAVTVAPAAPFGAAPSASPASAGPFAAASSVPPASATSFAAAPSVPPASAASFAAASSPPASAAPLAAVTPAPSTSPFAAASSPPAASAAATPPLPTSPPPPPPAELRAAPSPAPFAASPPPAPAKPVEIEFDGGATDISDVALMDFPVLTDAVDPPPPAPAAKPAPSPQPAAPKSAVAPPSTWSRPAAPPAPAAPVAQTKPRSTRIETAYTATRPPSPALAAAAAAATGAPSPSPASAAKPAATPTEPTNLDDDDVLRQTQTMRAIAVAKSIDDISSSMAETLFSDAELDLVTAALAAEWPDENDEAAEPQAEPAKPATAATLPADDPFDLFGLGDDAPLELIDDSAQPPKSASR